MRHAKCRTAAARCIRPWINVRDLVNDIVGPGRFERFVKLFAASGWMSVDAFLEHGTEWREPCLCSPGIDAERPAGQESVRSRRFPIISQGRLTLAMLMKPFCRS